ncbi:hypothetical protein V1523DRAFT_181017 [Lipomyces doorenjongii]
MSSEITVLQCTFCNHAPFDTKGKLTKHLSSKHRRAATFSFSGETFPLLATDDNKYVCPTCKAETSSVRSLKRHMGGQNCRGSQVIVGPTTYQPGDTQCEHGGATGTIADPHAMADLGFTIDDTWKVAICEQCHFIVDKSMIIDHLKGVHKREILNVDAVMQILRMYHLRPHLAVIWDDTSEDLLDESDDEDRQSYFTPPAFRPGSGALQRIQIKDGFKCHLCEERLHHMCVTTKEGLRTHHARYHRGEVLEYHATRVQAFYGRSKNVSQLRYVEVMETSDEAQIQTAAFGIPQDIHSIPDHNSTITDKRDLNQFGVKFQGYTLLDIVDLGELGNNLHKAEDDSFEILKGLCLRLLEASREDTRAGFQPMLGKVMVGESAKYVDPDYPRIPR